MLDYNRVYIGVSGLGGGIYRDYMRIMENKIETTIVYLSILLGLHWGLIILITVAKGRRGGGGDGGEASCGQMEKGAPGP